MKIHLPLSTIASGWAFRWVRVLFWDAVLRNIKQARRGTVSAYSIASIYSHISTKHLKAIEKGIFLVKEKITLCVSTVRVKPWQRPETLEERHATLSWLVQRWAEKSLPFKRRENSDRVEGACRLAAKMDDQPGERKKCRRRRDRETER